MSDQSSCSMHMTHQSSKSDLTNSAVLVILELADEVAIGKRMHVRDQSSKSYLINSAVCLSGCYMWGRKIIRLENEIAHYPKLLFFILFNIKTASLQGEQISRLRIPFQSILHSYKYHSKFDRFFICILCFLLVSHIKTDTSDWRDIYSFEIHHTLVYFRHTVLFQI